MGIDVRGGGGGGTGTRAAIKLTDYRNRERGDVRGNGFPISALPGRQLFRPQVNHRAAEKRDGRYSRFGLPRAKSKTRTVRRGS